MRDLHRRIAAIERQRGNARDEPGSATRLLRAVMQDRLPAYLAVHQVPARRVAKAQRKAAAIKIQLAQITSSIEGPPTVEEGDDAIA